jgi:prepilin-type N-terminal cleavage/methylation domain-containing protein/prepilin-type processing-associated H-X9-DG protein
MDEFMKMQIERAKIMKKRGFTLIELLVVIAIIGLLLAIVMPSLRKVKELGRLTICKTNLRSIHQALAIYAEENKDKVTDPRGSTKDATDPEVMWEGNPYKRWCRKWYLRFYPYLETPKIYVCPSWMKKSNMPYIAYQVGNDTFYVTYTANEFVFSLYNPERKMSYEYKYSELVRLAVGNNPVSVLLADGLYEVNGWGNWKDYNIESGELNSGRASYRHGGKANFLCADGRIGSVDKDEVNSWPDKGRFEEFKPSVLK